MGRRRDPDQQAKGFPNKRQSKTEKAVAEAERIAKLLTQSDEMDMPSMISDARLAAAAAVWREYVPELKRLNILGSLDRHNFAMFCVYLAEWTQMNQLIVDNGVIEKLKTTTGSWKTRPHAALQIRDNAHDRIMEYSAAFGLTPVDRAKLFKGQLAAPGGGLFGQPEAPQKPKDTPADEATKHVDAGVIGMFNQFDARAKPTGKPN